VNQGKIRTIIRTKRFERETARLVPSVRRADEFLEGAETILSRQPEAGFRLENLNVWFISGYTVDVVLYYTFDDDRVYFLSIQKLAPPAL